MMDALKRVSWRVGQPLLPGHLVAQEDSLIAYAHVSFKQMGFPLYGFSVLKWEETLLNKGIVSVQKLTVVFSGGHVVNSPGNSTVKSFDLNQSGKDRVTLYLHLLSSKKEEEEFLDSGLDQEKIVYAINQLELSDDPNAPMVLASIKIGEFKKDLNGYWKFSLDHIPPLLSVKGTPFFEEILFGIKTKLGQFQDSIEMSSKEEGDFEGHTLETMLCLKEIAKMRRLLANIEAEIATHPFILYETLNQYLETIALLYKNKGFPETLPYQHEKLGPLFKKMVDLMSLEEVASQAISHLTFEKKDRCYLSEKLPQELQDAKEIFLIIQKIDQGGNPNIEGLKLSAYGRLMNTVIFGVQGISTIRIDRAPFSHSFSKRANVFSIEKGIEWNHALKEGRLAFDYKDNHIDVQASLYWR